MAEALERKFNADYWVPAEIAWRFAQAGDKNKALDWLEVGYENVIRTCHTSVFHYLIPSGMSQDLRRLPAR